VWGPVHVNRKGRAAESPWATSVSPVQGQDCWGTRGSETLTGRADAGSPTSPSTMTSPARHPRGATGASFRRRTHRLHVRKMLLTWSPLTESNRRPSPYHPQFRGFTARWRSRRATASDGQATAVARHGAGNVRLRDSGRARRAAGVKGADMFRSGPIREAGRRPVTGRPTVG
jgi:hypothetical protein